MNCKRSAVRWQIRCLFFGLLGIGLAGLLPAWQQEHPVTGRRIAQVMGMGGANWLDRPEREMEEAPDAALDAIDIQTGMTVADVGAGTGYFTLRLARRVGADGKVYANDIQAKMLERLQQNAKAAA